MAFILALNITIGSYTFTRCNSVEIKKSANLVADTAIIKVPVTAVLKSEGETTTIEIAKEIKVGMPVTIQLAYEGDYAGFDFVGYVKRLNYKTPLEIECEDAVYLLRQKNINKGWPSSVKLKEIMEEIISDVYIDDSTPLELAGDLPEIEFNNYYIKNASAAWALQEIRDKYGLTIYMNDENKLYAGLAYIEGLDGQPA